MSCRLAFVSILSAMTIGSFLSVPSQAQNLNVYCAMAESDCRDALKMFEEDTGITSSVVRMSGGEIAARVRAERHNPQAGLWFTGAVDNFIQAAREGLLAPHKAVGIEKIDGRNTDKDNMWTPVSWTPQAFVYNETILADTGLEPPTSWQSFADPIYKNSGIVLPHPASSGSAYVTLATMIQLFDEQKAFELMKNIDANVVQYTRSGLAPSRMVASEEVGLAVSFTHDIEALLAQGYQIAYRFPQEGTGFEINAAAIIAGAPEEQRKAAAVFLDWILGERGQTAMGATFRTPIVADYKIPNSKVDISNVRLIDYDFAWAGENRARLLERYEREVRQRADAK